MQKIDCHIEFLPNYDPEWGLPLYAKPGDAGFDLRAAIDKPIYLVNEPDDLNIVRKIIPCGFKIAIPDGYQLEIRPRSGLAAKYGITVLNSPGTIDSGYRGEIQVILLNTNTSIHYAINIQRGDKIAQAVLMPVYQANFIQVEQLDETERGEGGFGHTGV